MVPKYFGKNIKLSFADKIIEKLTHGNPYKKIDIINSLTIKVSGIKITKGKYFL